METYEELKAQKQTIDSQIEELQAEKRRLKGEMDKLAEHEEARRKVEAMSDPERQALAQALEIIGIESGEEVGTPGAD